MLPQAVFDLLQFDLKGAADSAARGDVETGRELLKAGLHRALQARSDGQPWGEELLRQYEAGLANYARKYDPPQQP